MKKKAHPPSPAKYFKLHPVSSPGAKSTSLAQFRARGSDPTHCGCLWTPDHVSKRRGRDLLTFSGQWRTAFLLIFLLTLAPHLVPRLHEAPVVSAFSRSSSERCGPSCHPLSFSFGMPFPFRSKEAGFYSHVRSSSRPLLIELLCY